MKSLFERFTKRGASLVSRHWFIPSSSSLNFLSPLRRSLLNCKHWMNVNAKAEADGRK